MSTVTLGLLGLLPLQSKLSDNKEPLLLENKVLDAWISTERYAPGDDSFVQGPTVLRSRHNPAFIWQISSINGWGIKSQTPYLIVVKDSDSMRLLTAFNAGSVNMEPKIATSGRIQNDEFFGLFYYTIGLVDPDEETEPVDPDKEIEVVETFSFHGESEERVYDLSAGRVFVVEKSATKSGFVVSQAAWELPSKELLDSTNKMSPDAKQISQRFAEWLSKASAP